MVNGSGLSFSGSQNCAALNMLDTPQWYVAYTYPRHEKAVADQLERKSVDVFLPTYTQTSQWKDRKVSLEVPLFPGYVFARIAAQERIRVLSIPSVVRMLSYHGTLASVSDDEIETIRVCMKQKGRLRPHPYLAVGDFVRIREGVFEGVQGIIMRHANGCRLIVSIGLIEQSVAIEMDAEDLEFAGPAMGTSQTRPCRAKLPFPSGDVRAAFTARGGCARNYESGHCQL